MPSRHNRNARKNNNNDNSNDYLYQQPTPSSRPSPDAYPSPSPDDWGNSSTDSFHRKGRNGVARSEAQPEYQDSGGQMLVVSNLGIPQSLPTPPIQPTPEDDSTVAWNLEEREPEDAVSSRPSTNPSSNLNSTDNSAANSRSASSAASPSSSNPVSPSLRSIPLASPASSSPGPPTAIPESLGGRGQKKRGKKTRKQVQSQSQSSGSPPSMSLSTLAQPRLEVQAEPHVQHPQLYSVELAVPGPRLIDEEEGGVREVSGLFSNLMDFNDSPGVDHGMMMDVAAIDTMDIAASGSGSGAISVNSSMEGTIRPSRMKHGGGHVRTSVSDYEAGKEYEFGSGNHATRLFEEGSMSAATVQVQNTGFELAEEFEEEYQEPSKQVQVQPAQSHLQSQVQAQTQGSGLSQTIGIGLWRDGDVGYPQQHHTHRETSNPSLLSKPISGTVPVKPVGHGASGDIGPELSPVIGQGTVTSGEGHVRIAPHGSSNVGNSRSSSNNSIPVVANGGADEGDVVLWARWDESLSGKRLLFLAYHPSGLQIWDCTDLSSITEVLNLPTLSSLNSLSSGSLQDLDLSKMTFEYAGIIPRPIGSSGKDFLGSGDEVQEDFWPLAGILVSPVNNELEHDNDEHRVVDNDSTGMSSVLVVYSLTKHHVIQTVQLSGLAIGGGRFEVGQETVVVSTTQPPTLHILSSSTFKVLHRISEASLSTFFHKPPTRSPSSSGPNYPHSHSASVSSASTSQRHSFLSTTSNLVNGIYNNYNEHFNDIYPNKHNNKINISDRDNVLLNTVDDDSFSTTSGFPYHLYQRPTPDRVAATLPKATTIPIHPIPDPIALPAPVFAVSSRLLAYASPTPLSTDSNVGSIHPLSANAARTRGNVALNYSSTLSDAAVSTASAFGSTLSAQLANLGNNNAGGSAALGALSGIGQMSQADIGNAALKVGGSMLSGMKSLGGLAYKGAVAAASGNNAGSRSGSKGGMSAFANKFFSRSAPATTEGVRDRRYSTNSTASAGFEEVDSGKSGVVPDNPEDRSSVLPKTVPSTESGYYVTVVDLSTLFDTFGSLAKPSDKSGHAPTVIARFITSKYQPVADIWFSQDGSSLLVAPRDGQVAQVFGVRTSPISRMTQDGSERRLKGVHDSRAKGSSGRRSSSTSRPSFKASTIPDVPPLHVYNLRRGRTPAVIESAKWADDGRWVALGTRKRTVHVFAVNPYGGKSDVRSHMEGKVRNYMESPPLSTELYPMIRLRVSRYPGPDQPPVPLAFVFLKPSPLAESSMPTNLLPPFTSPLLSPTQQHSYGSVSSTHTVMSSSSPSTRSEPISPHNQQLNPGSGRPKNYQDILVFDPTDGLLSLRRLTADVKLKEGSSILNTSLGGFSSGSIGGVSRSLPGMSGAGRLSTSPSKALSGNPSASGLTQIMEGPNEIVGKENTVATWSLRRRREWGEIRRVLEEPSSRHNEQSQSLEDNTRTTGTGRVGKVDWLAQAELSTCSKMPRVLPRSLYLSHQFSFHALGEDYHALIRRYHFDIPGPKIEVRKGIEVSAYPTGTSESFVEAGGFATHRDARRGSASFDEPLASALAGGLDYTSPQPVLPMLPNGMPGSKPRSFKNPIPIRRMGDNAAESIGRLKREINRVRSPQLAPSSDNSISPSVALEFDEEDEDFLDRDVATARVNVRHTVSPSVLDDSGATSTPESNEMSVDGDTHTPNDDAWEGWVGQDQQAVDEVEAFDHISAVGFLDEEQEIQAHTRAQAQAGNTKKKGKKSRRN